MIRKIFSKNLSITHMQQKNVKFSHNRNIISGIVTAFK